MKDQHQVTVPFKEWRFIALLLLVGLIAAVIQALYYPLNRLDYWLAVLAGLCFLVGLLSVVLGLLDRSRRRLYTIALLSFVPASVCLFASFFVH